ncbi:DUF1801 domain-containing protein [Fictibacillus norfolkensis]|jgi:hypothetical protein|uniref:DUF1801 domain-containing protein n=1 Tax=Fictibacillus norfolkensis TaxID=2762233 RepID=A0ABR8SNZ6_9BACL|nr:DUF1801 domain-containing protein [Fictibacillus norfolkensis]MBD7965207.1 DUF1801 domain-containing protein [Fictibacillus norfolkensis]
MNQDVTHFIEELKESWQVDLSTNLRGVVHQAIPNVNERIQYKKPHFLKNGKYAAVISTSKDAVSFTIFNANSLELPEDLFSGPPERKTIKLRKGDTVDSKQLISFVREASNSL